MYKLLNLFFVVLFTYSAHAMQQEPYTMEQLEQMMQQAQYQHMQAQARYNLLFRKWYMEDLGNNSNHRQELQQVLDKQINDAYDFPWNNPQVARERHLFTKPDSQRLYENIKQTQNQVECYKRAINIVKDEMKKQQEKQQERQDPNYPLKKDAEHYLKWYTKAITLRAYLQYRNLPFTLPIKTLSEHSQTVISELVSFQQPEQSIINCAQKMELKSLTTQYKAATEQMKEILGTL